MLDRVAVTMPQWQERHTADLGIALIETLAYVGDYLSYRQDAVATEAYLGTARSRVSVRRHARLVDYRMHEGVSARVWLHVPVTADTALPKGTQAFTRIDGLQSRFTRGSSAHNSALAASTEVFETLHDATLSATHNEIRFYTWGSARCCLPAGATSATLLGAFPKLKIDDVVVFEEILGPTTGLVADADPTHRHAVRLSAATISSDAVGGRFATPPNTGPVAITEIEWVAEDALPFPLCISAEVRSGNLETPVEGISIARGNVVLADNGRTIAAERLNPVPRPDSAAHSSALATTAARCRSPKRCHRAIGRA
jgi:predicted phage baseplate assembly protein